MKRFKGFTLSELMIALAVLGILVAVVTPAIMRNRPNKNKMMVKKTFYTTEQIVSSLINDEALYPDSRDLCVGENAGCKWGFDDEDEAVFEGEKYSGGTKFYELFKSRLNVKQEDDDKMIFYTSDGAKWDLSKTEGAWTTKSKPGNFDNAETEGSGIGKIVIDVDGSDVVCKDNVDCGKYEIQILANGKLRINPDHNTAVEWATIQTSIKDTVN